MDFDVLVVGAGPSGCTAASQLARAGWRVGMLEEHGQIGASVNCSGVISSEAFHGYQLPPGLIRHAIQSFDFHSPGGLHWRFLAPRVLAYAVDRSQFDQILGHRASEAGAQLLLQHRVSDIESSSDRMIVRAQTPESDLVEISSRAVILATGAGVPLLQKLGWGTFSNHLLGAQTVVPFEASSVEVYLGRRWAPEGFAWSIPLGDGTAKVGLLSDCDGPQHLRRFLERPDVLSRIRGEPGPIMCSILPLGFLPRSYGDRLVVVGEAAGHIKATTCGGIYYGMLTAGLAAEVLDKALDDDQLDQRRLSDYEKKWRRLLEDEICVGLKLRRAFKFASDSMLDRLVSLASKDGIAKLIQDKADFDWHRELIGEVFRHATVGSLLRVLPTNGEKNLSFAPLEPLP